MSSQELVHTYRKLYKTGLQAIRFSSPAKYQLRDILRSRFRDSPSLPYDGSRIANTLRFLKRAKRNNGTEHKIIKNLLYIRYWRVQPLHKSLSKVHVGQQTPEHIAVRKEVWQHYDATLAMLNESQQLCLSM